MTLTKREAGQANEFLAVMSGKVELKDCHYLGKEPQKRKQTEAGEQSMLIQWADRIAWKYPEATLLFHIANGGHRDAIEAAHLKAQGVKAGVPDLFLPTAKGGYNGLFLEMKAPGGRLQPNQREWLDTLNEQGYRAVTCFGFEQAKAEIERYLQSEKPGKVV